MTSKRDQNSLAESFHAWQRQCLEPSLKKNPETHVLQDDPQTTIHERLYLPKSAADGGVADYLEGIGFPGQFPFTRGLYPTMYRSQLWTMRQYAGFGTARESNERYRYLLKQGQTGLSVAFDLPTQMGYDSDHPMALGEVGRVGVAIDSIEDMRALLHKIPLDQVSTSMTINATAPILLALYLAVARRGKVSTQVLRGTVQNDILKEYMARGTYIYPPRPSLRLIMDLMVYCAQEAPLWNTISVSGYHIREAGSTAVQELAFTLANGLTYMEEARQRNLDLEKIASRMSFFFNVHNHFLEEVAKFRAARRLWAKLLRERFGLNDSRAFMLRFHAQTAGSTLTAQQPMNNVVRVTLQAMAAVLGGAQSLHTNSMDEALGLPTQEAVTLALRTQQVIAFESGVCRTVDPLGGAYLIEEVTDELERQARKYLESIDSMGGMLKAIEAGYPQREIQHSAYVAQKQIEKQEKVVVGVNRFTCEEEEGIPILRIDPRTERSQVKGLRAFRAKRSQRRVKASLREVNVRAQGGENLMPAILAAVENGVTLGEISDQLREVFGVYREVQVV